MVLNSSNKFITLYEKWKFSNVFHINLEFFYNKRFKKYENFLFFDFDIFEKISSNSYLKSSIL